MLLDGKKGLVLNVTNQFSLGWAIAQSAVRHGAQVGVGAQNERNMETLQKLTDGNPAFNHFMVDFTEEDQLVRLREEVEKAYGKIDFLVHSAAFARREDLMGRFIDTSRDGFAVALDISCYSFISLCRTLEPVMADDSSIITLSYLGSTRACINYNLMGVAKAALESAVRYLSIDLGERGIRVNTLSPGPINTTAARGIAGLKAKIDTVHERSPLKRTFAQDEVGENAMYLISDLSKGVTGQILFVDNGYNVAAI